MWLLKALAGNSTESEERTDSFVLFGNSTFVAASVRQGFQQGENLQMVINDIKKNYSELQIREILTLTWGRVGWMSIWRGLQKENVPLVFAAPLPVLPWILIDEFSMQWNKLFTRRRDTGNIFVFIFHLCYCCWKRRQLLRSVLVIVNCYVLFFLFCSLCYFYSCPFSGCSGCLPRIWSTYCFLKVLNKSNPPPGVFRLIRNDAE